MSAQGFFDNLKNSAIELYYKTGILPSITMAQAALESGYGTSALARNDKNLFGIKGTGPAGSSAWKTTEYENGVKVNTTANFRSYNSWSESISDYGELLTGNKRYSGVVSATNAQSASVALGKSGFATDPKYSQKILGIITKYGLSDIDSKVQRTNTGMLITQKAGTDGGIANLLSDPLGFKKSATDATKNIVDSVKDFFMTVFWLIVGVVLIYMGIKYLLE